MVTTALSRLGPERVTGVQTSVCMQTLVLQDTSFYQRSGRKLAFASRLRRDNLAGALPWCKRLVCTPVRQNTQEFPDMLPSQRKTTTPDGRKHRMVFDVPSPIRRSLSSAVVLTQEMI